MTDVAPYVKRLLELPENEFCADCQKPHPTWASTTFGVFICINCSGIHRNLGTHITLVRSVTLDTWTTKQYKVMKKVGNARSNDYFEARLKGTNGRPSSTDRQSMERFIYDKYVLKLFAADGPPPHISLLMPNPNKENNIHHENIMHNQNISNKHNQIHNQSSDKFQITNESSNSIDTSSQHHNESNLITKHDTPHHSKKCSQINSQPKFARPLNFTSHEQNSNKTYLSSTKFTIFNDFLSSDNKNSSDSLLDSTHNNKENILIQIKTNKEIDDSIIIDDTIESAHENQRSTTQNLLYAVGVKCPTQEKDTENKVEIAKCETTKQRSNSTKEKSSNDTIDLFATSNKQKHNNFFTKSDDSSHLPKFAKLSSLDENDEAHQLEEINTQGPVLETKRSQKLNIKYLLETVGIQNEQQDSKKSENDNITDDIEFSFEKEEIALPSFENDNSCLDNHTNDNHEHERKVVLPKFAKKKFHDDKDESSDSSVHNLHNQSNEVFEKLNFIKDQKERLQNKLKSANHNSISETKIKDEELIFINPGIEEEEEQVQPKINSTPILQNKEPIEKTKPHPKFAKKKDDESEKTSDKSTENNLSNNQQILPPTPDFLQDHKQSKITNDKSKNKMEEEFIFINLGVEEEQVQQNINSNSFIQSNQPLEKTKSLPRFAKKKDDEHNGTNDESTGKHSFENTHHNLHTQSNEVFDILNHLQNHKEQQYAQYKHTTDNNKPKKNKEENEELIFINPGVEEEIQPQIQPQVHTEVEPQEHSKPEKSLPKFAKKKGETEDQPQNDNNEIFSTLIYLKKKTDEPITLKNNSNKDNLHKKEKELNEEELVFINPGVEESDLTEIQNQNVVNLINSNNINEEESNPEELTKKKALPKFAKKKDENDDKDIQALNNNQNSGNNGLLFEVLNHLK